MRRIRFYPPSGGLRRGFTRLRPGLRRGFTLIEGLLVIAIFGVVSGVSVPIYMRYQQRNDVSLAAENATEGINRACILSQLGEGDSGWGYSVTNGILFKGSSYAARDTSFDETYPVFSGVAASGPGEIAFHKMTCDPVGAGSITFQAGGMTTTIVVQSGGTVVRSNDKLTICHKPLVHGGNTLSVSDSAWPAHQGHGDTLGACGS